MPSLSSCLHRVCPPARPNHRDALRLFTPLLASKHPPSKRSRSSPKKDLPSRQPRQVPADPGPSPIRSRPVSGPPTPSPFPERRSSDPQLQSQSLHAAHARWSRWRDRPTNFSALFPPPSAICPRDQPTNALCILSRRQLFSPAQNRERHTPPYHAFSFFPPVSGHGQQEWTPP